MQNSRGSLIVVSGFSGAGKGTLMKNLIKRNDRYALSVSMTTREPREGEVDGRDYFFATTEKFEQKIRDNGFLEYAGYVDHYYGTPRDYVEKHLSAGKDVILEIDAQGAAKVRALVPESVLVFVVTPTVKILIERLKGRGSEKWDAYTRRIEQAAREVKVIDSYDYLVVNDDLDKCTDDIEAIIRVSHLKPRLSKDLISELSVDLDRLIANGFVYAEA